MNIRSFPSRVALTIILAAASFPRAHGVSSSVSELLNLVEIDTSDPSTKSPLPSVVTGSTDEPTKLTAEEEHRRQAQAAYHAAIAKEEEEEEEKERTPAEDNKQSAGSPGRAGPGSSRRRLSSAGDTWKDSDYEYSHAEIEGTGKESKGDYHGWPGKPCQCSDATEHLKYNFELTTKFYDPANEECFSEMCIPKQMDPNRVMTQTGKYQLQRASATGAIYEYLYHGRFGHSPETQTFRVPTCKVWYKDAREGREDKPWGPRDQLKDFPVYLRTGELVSGISKTNFVPSTSPIAKHDLNNEDEQPWIEKRVPGHKPLPGIHTQLDERAPQGPDLFTGMFCTCPSLERYDPTHQDDQGRLLDGPLDPSKQYFNRDVKEAALSVTRKLKRQIFYYAVETDSPMPWADYVANVPNTQFKIIQDALSIDSDYRNTDLFPDVINDNVNPRMDLPMGCYVEQDDVDAFDCPPENIKYKTKVISEYDEQEGTRNAVLLSFKGAVYETEPIEYMQQCGCPSEQICDDFLSLCAKMKSKEECQNVADIGFDWSKGSLGNAEWMINTGCLWTSDAEWSAAEQIDRNQRYGRTRYTYWAGRPTKSDPADTGCGPRPWKNRLVGPRSVAARVVSEKRNQYSATGDSWDPLTVPTDREDEFTDADINEQMFRSDNQEEPDDFATLFLRHKWCEENPNDPYRLLGQPGSTDEDRSERPNRGLIMPTSKSDSSTKWAEVASRRFAAYQKYNNIECPLNMDEFCPGVSFGEAHCVPNCGFRMYSRYQKTVCAADVGPLETLTYRSPGGCITQHPEFGCQETSPYATVAEYIRMDTFKPLQFEVVREHSLIQYVSRFGNLLDSSDGEVWRLMLAQGPMLPELLGTWYDAEGHGAITLSKTTARLQNKLTYNVVAIRPYPQTSYTVVQYMAEQARVRTLRPSSDIFTYEGSKKEPFYTVVATKFSYELVLRVPDATKQLSHGYLQTLFKKREQLLVSQVFSAFEFSDVGGVKHTRAGEYLRFVIKPFCLDPKAIGLGQLDRNLTLLKPQCTVDTLDEFGESPECCFYNPVTKMLQ